MPITNCQDLSLGVYDDWYLPNYNQLYAIADRNRYDPAIDPVFTNTTSSFYWASTIANSDPNYAWDVNFNDGVDGWGYRSRSYYVRCVRDNN